MLVVPQPGLSFAETFPLRRRLSQRGRALQALLSPLQRLFAESAGEGTVW